MSTPPPPSFSYTTPNMFCLALAQTTKVGRRTTKNVRRRHARYLETGSSKELYAVLVALAAPPRRSGEEEDGEEDDGEEDDDEEEEEEDGACKEVDEDSEEVEEKEGSGGEEGREGKDMVEGAHLSHGKLSKEATAGGRKGAHAASDSGGSGLDFGGVKRALQEVEEGGYAGDACDAPEL